MGVGGVVGRGFPGGGGWGRPGEGRRTAGTLAGEALGEVWMVGCPGAGSRVVQRCGKPTVPQVPERWSRLPGLAAEADRNRCCVPEHPACAGSIPAIRKRLTAPRSQPGCSVSCLLSKAPPAGPWSRPEVLLSPDSADDRRDGLDDHGPGGKTDGRSASRAMGGGEVVPQLRGLVGAGGRQFTARPLRPGGPAALTTASVLEGLSASRSASPSGNPAAPLPPALHPWKPATR